MYKWCNGNGWIYECSRRWAGFFYSSSFCLFAKSNQNNCIHTSLLKMSDDFDHLYTLFSVQRSRMRTCWMNSCVIFNVHTRHIVYVQQLRWKSIKYICRCAYACVCCARGAFECDDIRLNEMNDEHTKKYVFLSMYMYLYIYCESADGRSLRCQVLSFS